MVKIQGHRGYSEVYPENTMLAFRKTHEAGADGIETDIRQTVDGHFVCIHDATLDRTTNGSGYVGGQPLSYIQSLDAGGFKDAAFAGRADCKVPTLIEMLDDFRYKDITLVLQLYVDGNANLEAIVNLVRARGMLGKVHFFGQPAKINHIKQYESNAYTLNDGMPDQNYYQPILDNAVLYGHNAVSIANYPDFNTLQAMIQNIKSQGKEVHISYLQNNYASQIETLINLGADYVLGNNPQIMKQYAYEVELRSFELIKQYKSIVRKPYGLLELGSAYHKTTEGYIKGQGYKVLR